MTRGDPTGKAYREALAEIRAKAPDAGHAVVTHVDHLQRLLARYKTGAAAQPTSQPDSQQIAFITNEGDHYADVPLEELDATARLFIAELLEHIDDKDHVVELLAGLSLLEGLPSELVFGSTIRILVTDVLASLQLASPELSMTFQVAAAVLRQEKRA